MSRTKIVQHHSDNVWNSSFCWTLNKQRLRSFAYLPPGKKIYHPEQFALGNNLYINNRLELVRYGDGDHEIYINTTLNRDTIGSIGFRQNIAVPHLDYSDSSVWESTSSAIEGRYWTDIQTKLNGLDQLQVNCTMELFNVFDTSGNPLDVDVIPDFLGLAPEEIDCSVHDIESVKNVLRDFRIKLDSVDQQHTKSIDELQAALQNIERRVNVLEKTIDGDAKQSIWSEIQKDLRFAARLLSKILDIVV